jgi:hypothetical protein
VTTPRKLTLRLALAAALLMQAGCANYLIKGYLMDHTCDRFGANRHADGPTRCRITLGNPYGPDSELGHS